MSSFFIRGVLALVVLSSAPGCLHHVHAATDRLSVASPGAPFRERQASFETLRPEGLDVTHIIHYDRMFGRHERYVDALHLVGGTTVYSPDVLLTAVEPDSPTARSIARYDLLRRRTNRRLWISRGFALAALGALATTLAVKNDNAQVGAAATTGGLLLGWVGTRFALRRGMRNRDQAEYDAYLTYDADLADHLGLCVNDDTVSACP